MTTAMKLSTDYFQKGNILMNNDQLRILVAELLKERNKVLELNCQLRKANIEIARKNKHISSINAQLEAAITEKSHDIQNLNRKIVRFAEYNAHRIRGPLARIIGLIQIMNLDFTDKKVHDRDFEFCLEGLNKSAGELDEMVKDVTKLLNENDVSAEKVKMRYRLQEYIRRITTYFSGLFLRCTSLFLGSAGAEKIHRFMNLK